MQFGKYDTWNVKKNCEAKILDGIRTFLNRKNLFGTEWLKVIERLISMLLTEVCVRDQITLMEDKEESK